MEPNRARPTTRPSNCSQRQQPIIRATPRGRLVRACSMPSVPLPAGAVGSSGWVACSLALVGHHSSRGGLWWAGNQARLARVERAGDPSPRSRVLGAAGPGCTLAPTRAALAARLARVREARKRAQPQSGPSGGRGGRGGSGQRWCGAGSGKFWRYFSPAHRSQGGKNPGDDPGKTLCLRLQPRLDRGHVRLHSPTSACFRSRSRSWLSGPFLHDHLLVLTCLPSCSLYALLCSILPVLVPSLALASLALALIALGWLAPGFLPCLDLPYALLSCLACSRPPCLLFAPLRFASAPLHSTRLGPTPLAQLHACKRLRPARGARHCMPRPWDETRCPRGNEREGMEGAVSCMIAVHASDTRRRGRARAHGCYIRDIAPALSVVA